RHFAASGLAMLRSGSGDAAAAVLLKASGDDGDAHGHPDQLGAAIFMAGARIAIDPGTPGYGIPLNDTWYRQSGAHSAVLLDSRSQPPGHARITQFDSTAERTIVEAEIEWPPLDDWPAVVERARHVAWPDRAPYEGYAGVRMRRRLELRTGELVDTSTVEAPQDRQIDLVLHLSGSIDFATEPAPGALSGPCGYDQLQEVRRIERGQPDLAFGLASGGLAIGLESEPGDELFVASAPGNPAA